MKTFQKTIRRIEIVTQIIVIAAAFNLLCLVSAECREIRRDCRSKGECIDPINPLLDQLESLSK